MKKLICIKTDKDIEKVRIDASFVLCLVRITMKMQRCTENRWMV